VPRRSSALSTHTLRTALLALGAFFMVALAGCGEEVKAKPKPPLEVAVIVTSDPGKPIEGAEIVYAGKTIKKTDEKGIAKLSLKGNDGDSYEVRIKCPKGFQSPSKTLTIPLQRLSDPNDAPEYDIACPPVTRTVVVAVRADNGPNLPVSYLGRPVGRTDGSGAATILVPDVDADSHIVLTLDTTEKGNEGLKPQNPINTFVVKGQDDVFAWDQKFVLDAPKAKVWGGGPARTGPVALPTKTNR
jgi:hypothetical protein